MASKSPSNLMRFNVGGKTFETTATTLAVAGPNSFFGPLLNGNWTYSPLFGRDAIFIDRDPKCFSVILNLLRTGELHIPSNVPKDLFLKEAQFYGVLELVRASTWGPLDGNRLSLSTSVTIPMNPIGSVIRASPTGGCCVSGDSIIRVYDWMLRQQSPIILDFESVNDIAWIDSKNIIVTEPQSMRLFDLSSGEQTQKFHFTQVVKNDNNYSFSTLCLDNDCRIYSFCYGKGIGVWDRERSEPIDFFHYFESDNSKVDKVQWLPGTKCLLVGSNNTTKTHPINYCLKLLDFRQKNIVWSWSQVCDEKKIQIRDMVMMESRNTIFVVDKDENIGSIDMRSNSAFLHWSPTASFWNGYNFTGQKVKLIEHEGQLFSSNDGGISVYSTRDKSIVTTSKLHTINTSWINDLSIANDRLFSLRRDTMFDVWETSPLSPTL